MGTKPEAAAKEAARLAEQNKNLDLKKYNDDASRKAAEAEYNRVKAEQNKRK